MPPHPQERRLYQLIINHHSPLFQRWALDSHGQRMRVDSTY